MRQTASSKRISSSGNTDAAALPSAVTSERRHKAALKWELRLDSIVIQPSKNRNASKHACTFTFWSLLLESYISVPFCKNVKNLPKPQKLSFIPKTILTTITMIIIMIAIPSRCIKVTCSAGVDCRRCSTLPDGGALLHVLATMSF